MNKSVFVSAILLSSILLSGCSLVAQPADMKTESPDVTLTGTVVQAGTLYSLTTPGQAPIELDSRQVTLSNFVGKNVTVTGQYSGTTLFVSKIQ